MVDFDGIFFNVAAFVGGLFVLEFGADKFVDHTAKVASRLRVPETLIALLTAGAEWEELVVVIASISQSQSSLALGNILGSSISNILGAFSLGLIFAPSNITFDRSAKIYTGALLGLTTLFTLFILFFSSLGRFGGVVFITTFVVYIGSIAWAIYKGIVAPPVDSDSDSDSDSSDSDSDSSDEEAIPLKEKAKHTKPQNKRPSSHSRSNSSSTTTLHDIEAQPLTSNQESEEGGLAKEMFDDIPLTPKPSSKSQRSLLYHILQLSVGFLALGLSGYLLSHSITTLSELLSLNTTMAGVTILSFATTLPEKLISMMSASRGENGIVIANTAGSNIFLVTLCAGVLYVSGDLAQLKNSVTLVEIATMWLSSVVLFGIVMFGGRRWMGFALFTAYVGFIAWEFIGGRVDRDGV